MSNITSNELAQQLGCSQRHARRLILAGDSRISGPDRQWLERCSRKRQAELVIRHALAISDTLNTLARISAGEVYREGPELDALAKLIRAIRRQVIAVEGVGHDLYPHDHE
jgi:hypothetical protein